MFEQDEEPELSGPQRELERALTGLTPSPPEFSTRELRAAALLRRQRCQTRIWQAVAAALAVGVATLALLRPAPTVVQPQGIVQATPPPSEPRPAVYGLERHGQTSFPMPPDEGFAYLRMRQRVLLMGPDALRAGRPAAGSAHAAPSARWAPGGADALPGDRTPAGDATRPTFLDLLLPGGKT